MMWNRHKLLRRSRTRATRFPMQNWVGMLRTCFVESWDGQIMEWSMMSHTWLDTSYYGPNSEQATHFGTYHRPSAYSVSPVDYFS